MAAAYAACFFTHMTWLASGASPHTKDDLGAEPLHLAVREGHIGAARTIVKHVSQHDAQKAKGLIGALNANGSTILHLAVENGQLESVRFAIKVCRGASLCIGIC